VSKFKLLRLGCCSPTYNVNERGAKNCALSSCGRRVLLNSSWLYAHGSMHASTISRQIRSWTVQGENLCGMRKTALRTQVKSTDRFRHRTARQETGGVFHSRLSLNLFPSLSSTTLFCLHSHTLSCFPSLSSLFYSFRYHICNSKCSSLHSLSHLQCS